MRKLLSVLFVVLMLAGLAGGCHNEDVRSFKDIYRGEPTKISMLDGTKGLAFATEDPEFIQLLMNELHSLSLEKAKDQSPRAGYMYYADFFENETHILRVSFLGDRMSVNQVYYMLDQDINDTLREVYDLMASAQTSSGPGTEGRIYVNMDDGTMYYELPGCIAGEYRGDLKDGYPHGYGTWLEPGGGEYAGQWKNGQFHGEGRYTWPDGKYYEGEWEEGFPHGEGAMYFTDGTSVHGVWSGGRMVRPIDHNDRARNE